MRLGDRGSDQQRHSCSNSEAAGRCPCSLNWARTKSFGDAELVAGMRSQRIVGHQLLGNLFRERGIESSVGVNSRQLLVLSPAICFEFGAFELEVSLFGVGL